MFENFHPFKDMAESARAQHEVDKANFKAAKLESKAVWEEAKLTPKARLDKMQEEREESIVQANERIKNAQARIAEAKKAQKD